MMMLKSGDSNLNRFSHAFWESAMGGLKQAILGQELTFRDQVRDLHRLYWTQKNLMKELSQNALNEQFGGALYRNEYALFRNRQSNFNLQHPADAFITIDLNITNSLLETDLSQADGKFDVEKSLLSSVDSGCNEIIDLEDSMDLDCHDKAEQENNVCYVPSTVHFGGAHDRRSKEQTAHASWVGIENSSLDSLNDHSRNTDESRTVLFDLNMPVRNSDVHNSSEDSILADNNTKHFNDMESKSDANVVSSAYPVEGSIGSTDGALISINEAPIFSIGLSKQEKGVSPSDKLQLVEVIDNNWQDSNITSRNSINLLQTAPRDSTEKPNNDEKSEEDTLSSHATAEDEAQQNALLGKSYVGYNTNDMIECSSYEKEARGPATLSVTDDSVITQSHSTENEMSFFDKFQSEEQDIIATTAAAHTLMDIYFGRSAIATNKLDAFEVREVPCDDNSDDQLQVSSDSFETMTMHLSEIQNVEIMPDVSRLNVREKDEMRIRPRRGKGLRNYQKEILPGLVSLSRQEICEDLYGINYKFRRNTFRATENVFVPVTTRRSRLYSGGRRRRSFPC